MHGVTDGRMDERTDRQTDGSTDDIMMPIADRTYCTSTIG